MIVMGMMHLWMTDTVTLETRTGCSSTGAPTYRAPVSIKARVTAQSGMKTTKDGAEVSAHAVIHTETAIAPGDRVTDGLVPYIVTEVAECVRGNAVDHYRGVLA